VQAGSGTFGGAPSSPAAARAATDIGGRGEHAAQLRDFRWRRRSMQEAPSSRRAYGVQATAQCAPQPAVADQAYSVARGRWRWTRSNPAAAHGGERAGIWLRHGATIGLRLPSNSWLHASTTPAPPAPRPKRDIYSDLPTPDASHFSPPPSPNGPSPPPSPIASSSPPSPNASATPSRGGRNRRSRVVLGRARTKNGVAPVGARPVLRC
jgi:hypothetical protein